MVLGFIERLKLGEMGKKNLFFNSSPFFFLPPFTNEIIYKKVRNAVRSEVFFIVAFESCS